MNLMASISDGLLLAVIFGVICYGLYQKVNVFESFIEGAGEGLKVVVGILPTLIALMVAVAMLRTSGALGGIVRLLDPLISFTGFPTELVPIALLRTVSSSASTSLILDIFKVYGPDSFMGRLVSIMFGCTESIFYTMSIYFMTVKVKKTRFTLAGALIATFVGISVSYVLTLYIFGR
ncbi:MAG: spore maturation protein [Cellulosilyticaceae bacterium]